mgnify:CR=1 FL=1|tara:strand:+ start:108 stop:347 length:240 start_codon:yes stop_codon:yes gene_type:complete
MSNLEKYNKSFIETFSIKKDKLKKLKYNSIPKWDSIGHMSLVGKLEDCFNISMEMDDIIDFSSYEYGKKILKKYKIVIK